MQSAKFCKDWINIVLTTAERKYIKCKTDEYYQCRNETSETHTELMYAQSSEGYISEDQYVLV